MKKVIYLLIVLIFSMLVVSCDEVTFNYRMIKSQNYSLSPYVTIIYEIGTYDEENNNYVMCITSEDEQSKAFIEISEEVDFKKEMIVICIYQTKSLSDYVIKNVIVKENECTVTFGGTLKEGELTSSFYHTSSIVVVMSKINFNKIKFIEETVQ